MYVSIDDRVKRALLNQLKMWNLDLGGVEL